MNIVTASFNTTMRQMTEMSHDQNVSTNNDRNVSEKKQSLWTVVYLEQGLKHAGRMWPARTFCAARDAFWEFSNN